MMTTTKTKLLILTSILFMGCDDKYSQEIKNLHKAQDSLFRESFIAGARSAQAVVLEARLNGHDLTRECDDIAVPAWNYYTNFVRLHSGK